MTTIITRTGKGSPLTWAEADANFTGLNDRKLEKYSNLSDLDSIPTALVNLHLNNVNNTSDADKPISTATQNALDGKVDTSSLSASSGSSLVGFIQSGAVATNVQAKLREVISVKDFGAVGDGVTDDTAALTLARNFLAGNATRYKLIFPSGIYLYSVSPNWAIENAEIEAHGEVKLRYTGVGNAVILDAGSGSQLVYNVTMGRFIVEAPTTALNGVYVRSVHHSSLNFDVRGCGTTYSGLRVEFAVCTSFPNFTCSGNQGGGAWYAGAKPANGIFLSRRGAGEFASYCLFDNVIVEGLPIGINLDASLGCTFVGGTSEGCSTYGVYVGVFGANNKFIGVDFEANTVADVFNLGYNLILDYCDSDNIIVYGSSCKGGILNGGQHHSILIDTGAANCSVTNLIYNRIDTVAGTFTDAGTKTFVSNLWDGINSKRYMTGSVAYNPGTIVAGATSAAFVTVPGVKLGDQVIAGFTQSASGLMISAVVTSNDNVTVYFQNISGGPVVVTAGTVNVSGYRT